MVCDRLLWRTFTAWSKCVCDRYSSWQAHNSLFIQALLQYACLIVVLMALVKVGHGEGFWGNEGEGRVMPTHFHQVLLA